MADTFLQISVRLKAMGLDQDCICLHWPFIQITHQLCNRSIPLELKRELKRELHLGLLFVPSLRCLPATSMCLETMGQMSANMESTMEHHSQVP